MPPLSITQTAINYFTLAIVPISVAIYILLIKPKSRLTKIVLGIAIVSVANILLLGVEESLVPPNPLLYSLIWMLRLCEAALSLLLIQIAYTFPYPREAPHMSGEASWALRLQVGLLALMLVAMTFQELWWQTAAQNRLMFTFSGINAAIYTWGLLVVIRRRFGPRTASRHVSGSLQNEIAQKKYAQALHALPPLFLLMITNYALVNSSHQGELSNTTLDFLMLFVVPCILMACWLIYLNHAPEQFTIMIKLVGVALFALLISLGAVIYHMAPLIERTYSPSHRLEPIQSIRFARDSHGGYRATTVDGHLFHGDSPRDDNSQDWGEQLPIKDNGHYDVELGFPFPFYAQSWEAVYVHDDALLTFGEPYHEWRFSWHQQPAIAPFLTDLQPTDHSGTFIHKALDRVVITWHDLVQRSANEAVTIQAVLYQNGDIDFLYPAQLPTARYSVNPRDGLWLIGILPGNHSAMTEQFRFAPDMAYRGSPDQALVENLFIDFRLYLHQQLWPILGLVSGAMLLILIGFPLFYRVNLMNPIKALVDGVTQVNAGNLDVSVPPHYGDEIGFLTRSFNDMVTSIRRGQDALQEVNVTLEHRVEERTSELTEAKELAEAANRSKDAFLTNMSHELRTPLNAILGYAQILEQGNHLSDEAWTKRRLVGTQTIYQSGEHLLTMINDLIDAAKIESGKRDLQPVAIELASVIEGVAKVVRLQTQEKDLKLHIDMPKRLPTVWLDAQAVRQVLLNLLTNAVKFTEQGSISLRVRQIDRMDGEPAIEQRFRFEVEDTGTGIEPEHLQTIFDPFVQVGGVRARAAGIGLGLSISQRLVRLLGGKLSVQSTVGSGSLFWFELQIALVQGVEENRSQERLIRGYRDTPQKILIVDDVEENRAVLSLMLEAVGFETILAESGEDALEQVALEEAERTRPQLVMTDIMLPGISGLEVAATLRQSPTLSTIPIIAVSASVHLEDQQRCLDAGCDAFLSKPVQWPRLSKLLEKHLSLDWIFDDVVAADQDIEAGEADTLTQSVDGERTLPDHLRLRPEEFATLHELALLGDMVAIDAETVRLEKLMPEFAPLAGQLRKLAADFREQEILTLVTEVVDGDR